MLKAEGFRAINPKILEASQDFSTEFVPGPQSLVLRWYCDMEGLGSFWGLGFRVDFV